MIELLSYEEFGKLRIRTFFPAGIDLHIDETGSIECAIGPACTEGLVFTYFAWLPDRPRETAEISLDLRGECPAKVAQEILSVIGVPLNAGMSLNEVVKILGEPEFKGETYNGVTFVRMVVGKNWPYYVGCHISEKIGLIAVLIFRKDLWSEP